MFKFTISFIIIDFPLCIVIFFVFSFVFFLWLVWCLWFIKGGSAGTLRCYWFWRYEMLGQCYLLYPSLNCWWILFKFHISFLSLFRLSRLICNGVDGDLCSAHTNPCTYSFVFFPRGAGGAEKVQNLMVSRNTIHILHNIKGEPDV